MLPVQTAAGAGERPEALAAERQRRWITWIGIVASSTQLRDKAHRLAEVDPTAALKVAREVPEPWFRAQAVAAVARWIDDARVLPVANESFAAAEACDDDYKRAAVSAWPIRALLERGHVEPAQRALGHARSHALAATPAGSRAEALLSLLQGAWGLGAPARRQLVEDLLALRGQAGHWRASRALVRGLEMLTTTDPEAAREIAARVDDGRCRRKALDAIQAEGACGPRDYF